jgi:autotransporter-associated beta strand protein
LLFSGLPVAAQVTYYWRSEATNGNWNVDANWWRGYTEKPAGAEIIRFTNNNQASMTNDLPATNRYRIYFDSGAGSDRTIGGSTLNTFYDYGSIRPLIQNDSTAEHAINFPLRLGYSGGLELNPVNGNLTVGGTIDTNGNYIKVFGNNAKTLNLSGAISGGGGIELLENSIVLLSGNNSYTGTTTIQTGTLRLSGIGTLGTGSTVLIGSSGVLDLNGITTTVAAVKEQGSGNSGTIALGAGTLIVNGSNRGVLYQNSISGSGGVTMAGSGNTALSLFGSQSYSGATNVSGGKITSGVTMGTSSVTVTGGEFEMTADNKLGDAATLSVSGTGLLDIQGNDTVASLTASGGAVTLGSGKTLTVTGGSSIGSASTITGGTFAITGGTLVFDSASGSTSALDIGASATLKGTGTIGGATEIAGIHAPGNSVGLQVFSSTLEYAAGSFFEWELGAAKDTNSGGVRGTDYDAVNHNGLTVIPGATFKVATDLVIDYVVSSSFWAAQQDWTDIFSGPVTQGWAADTPVSVYSTSDLNNPRDVSSYGTFTISGTTLTWTPVPIPEPAAALAGVLLVAGLCYRRRNPMPA